MLSGLISGAAGLFGGGGGGAPAAGPVRGSQDGNQLRSGTGSFNVGGPSPWVLVTLGLLVLAVGWALWRKFK